MIDKLLCGNLVFIRFGPEKKNLNDTQGPIYASHVPDGTSVKNMIHFAQGVQSNIFATYNYSTPDKNQQHCNQTTPPIYTIRLITVLTAMFYGGEDWLADPIDVNYIFDQIQNQTLDFRKYIPDYNHLDFVWGITANKIIYSDLLDQMRKHHPAN